MMTDPLKDEMGVDILIRKQAMVVPTYCGDINLYLCQLIGIIQRSYMYIHQLVVVMRTYHGYKPMISQLLTILFMYTIVKVDGTTPKRWPSKGP